MKVLDLNDYEMPIFSIDRERQSGIPQLAVDFKTQISEADGIIMSFAEHNGSWSAAFKNVYDWISRLEKPLWSDKTTMLLATSPGGRGGQSVLEHAMATLPFRGANIAAVFSLPFFSKNFDSSIGITDEELREKFMEQAQAFETALTEAAVETA